MAECAMCHADVMTRVTIEQEQVKGRKPNKYKICIGCMKKEIDYVTAHPEAPV